MERQEDKLVFSDYKYIIQNGKITKVENKPISPVILLSYKLYRLLSQWELKIHLILHRLILFFDKDQAKPIFYRP